MVNITTCIYSVCLINTKTQRRTFFKKHQFYTFNLNYFPIVNMNFTISCFSPIPYMYYIKYSVSVSMQLQIISFWRIFYSERIARSVCSFEKWNNNVLSESQTGIYNKNNICMFISILDIREFKFYLKSISGICELKYFGSEVFTEE